MSTKDTLSYLTVLDRDGNVVQQSGNLSFRSMAKYRVISKWTGNSDYSPEIFYFPWKTAFVISDDDMEVGHSPMRGSYPYAAGTSISSDRQYGPMRMSGAVGTISSTAIARVFGAVGSMNTVSPSPIPWINDSIVSIVDVPVDYSQVGTVYIHPATMTGNTVTTTSGQNYVTFGSGGFFDLQRYGSPTFNLVRIESGTDAGMYLVQSVDFYNNRMVLTHLNGRAFSASSSATVPLTLCSGRRAWFNEVGIIPLSVGTVDTGTSRYAPRFFDSALRGSFVVRATLDKSGSTEASVGTEQQGSYFISIREFTHGEGGYGQNIYDSGGLLNAAITNQSFDSPSGFAFFDGGVNGYALDWANQRMWFGYTNEDDRSGIAMWKYKSPEQFREISNYTGTAKHAALLSPAITLGAGDRIVNLEAGSETGSISNRVYIVIGHDSGGNGGVAIIHPDLTTSQYKFSSGVLPSLPSPKIGASHLDKTRTRTGTSGDVVTTAASDALSSASASFLSSDLGRAIKLSGASADNDTYLISAVTSATQVQVTTLSGSAVSFAGSTGGTFEIGDRLYLFFDNTTTNSGKMTYMECLAPGTFLQRAVVSMTNGASVISRTKGRQLIGHGMPVCVSVDNETGDVYWLSKDTQQQINKFRVSDATHHFIAITNTNLLSPAGGSPSNPGTPSTFTAIKVSSKFDELWVGSDAGHFRITKSSSWAGGTNSPAALSTKRYYGPDNTSYQNPAGTSRTAGSLYEDGGGTNAVRAYYEAPDGKLWCCLRGEFSSNSTFASYSRETEGWYYKETERSSTDNSTWAIHIDRYGAVFSVNPDNADTYSRGKVLFGFVEVQYQWDAATSSWFAREVIQTGLPNKSTTDTIYNPGCLTRPIHSTLQDTFLGVKLRFNRQGGATPPNNEFLGRAGQTRATSNDGQTTASTATLLGSSFVSGDVGKLLRIEAPTTNADGATTLGGATFTGSGFVVGDVGKYLRINSGADTGTYKIAAYSSSTSVDLITLTGSVLQAKATASSLSYTVDRGADSGIYKIASFVGPTQVTLSLIDGSSWTATASTSPVSYTIWDQGSPGSNAGPENLTVLLSDGFAKDNTQDISGTTFETFGIKTKEVNNSESIKFAVSNPIAPPGATTVQAYWETYPRNLTQYDAATSHHRALPSPSVGAQLALGFNGHDLSFNGQGARTTLYSSPANPNSFNGISAQNGVLGYSLMVDLGVDVEVGYVILRLAGNAYNSATLLSYIADGNGLIGNLYKADSAGGAPAVSSSIRTSGVSVSATSNSTTVNAISGNFLGTSTTGPFSNGAMVLGQSTFYAATSPFLSSDVGKVLSISGNAGVDSGSYRIIAVSGDGTTATIRNLNQTTKTWSLSSSSVTYEVHDAVREEDMLCVPSLASPTYKLCVERLLSPTSLQVRTAPALGITAQTWDAVSPSWTPVKRLSYNTEALAPDVKANGTWISMNGAEDYGSSDVKIYFDLTDLTSAQRTGRWWKWTAIPRFDSSYGDSSHYLKGIEVYDVAGNKIAQSKYTSNLEAQTNPNFVLSWLNRADWVQASSTAMAGISGFNGTANLGGVSGNTVTLSSLGNKFLGFQIGPTLSDGALPIGTDEINSVAAAFPASASVGRFIRIQSGANSGSFYRISSRVSASKVTVVTPSGTAVAWAASETGITFSIHEGINVGGSTPDKFVFTSDGKELTIASINDALTAITIEESPQLPRGGQSWEIRRPGYIDRTASTPNSAKPARVLWDKNTFPVQTGDLSQGTRGHISYFLEDIGSGYQRSDGACASPNTFTGSGFTPDDVGRLLYIDTGVNVGIYEIGTYSSSTQVTLKNHYTGAAAVLTNDAGPITYRIYGDRRVRLTKYVAGVRS